jgi:adenine-specific DNA methylase
MAVLQAVCLWEAFKYHLVSLLTSSGSSSAYDKNNKEYNSLSAHNYFIVKSLDALKDGGVLNFVISASFLDNMDNKTAELINSKAKFIGAIRLPSDIFKGAGTNVTTDIVIFQKLKSGETGNIDTWSKKAELNGYKINQYFIDNESMLLGDWVKGFRNNGKLVKVGDLALADNSGRITTRYYNGYSIIINTSTIF